VVVVVVVEAVVLVMVVVVGLRVGFVANLADRFGSPGVLALARLGLVERGDAAVGR
jgi:hypothetical protein